MAPDNAQLTLDHIVESLPHMRTSISGLREIILANTVMVSEIPAPTFREQERMRFLSDRFRESNLHNIATDEAGNCMAVLPGNRGERNLLICAHADTAFDESADHTVSLQTDTISGAGLADNSLGLAVVASIPTVLERLGLALESNLVFLGAGKSLGRGNLQGLRFFLDNAQLPFGFGLCVEGVYLGRLSFSGLGMLRGELTCTVARRAHRTRSGETSAIAAINQVITRILAIPLPGEPKTSIILGSILCGGSFNLPTRSARLRFEIRSKQTGMVSRIREEIKEIVEAVGSEPNVEVELEIVAQLRPGGIAFRHPLVRSTRRIIKALGIAPRIAPSVGDLSAMIAKKIPSVTLGITTGDQSQQGDTLAIDPIFSGIAQVVAVLKAMDGGLCNGD